MGPRNQRLPAIRAVPSESNVAWGLQNPITGPRVAMNRPEAVITPEATPAESSRLREDNTKTFPIDSENNITVFDAGESVPEKEGVERFKTVEELRQLAAAR